MSFEHAWVLALLPLALLPFLRWGGRTGSYSWTEMIPRDRPSTVLAFALRLAGALAIAALIAGLAAPYRAEVEIERFGSGAEIVLLFDRSRSMDQPFGPAAPDRSLVAAQGESKAAVARRLLAEFAASRREDLFALTVFSTYPISILDFTHKQAAIQATIAASAIGRGLADTDIGLALEQAIARFDDRPYSGSRIIMLVSDGGAHIDVDARDRITDRMKRNRAALYWIYLRSAGSAGLLAGADVGPEQATAVPEHFLHRFFLSMGTPYHAYEAENPEALRRAIEDVNRLEKFPIYYVDILPRQNFARAVFGVALFGSLLLLAGSLLEPRRWP